MNKLMKDLNKLGKEYVDEALILGLGIFLWNIYIATMPNIGRAGITSIITGFGGGVALIVIGWILIIIPEPATTLTGFVMVGIGVSMVGGMITYLSNLLGQSLENPIMLIGAVALILGLIYVFTRGRKQPIMYAPSQMRRFR